MILSWETLVYQWIFAEVFHANEELANPSSCITLVCVACLFDTGLVKINWFHKITLSEKVIWFDLVTHPCLPFSENNSHLRNWRNKINLTMLRNIPVKESANMCCAFFGPLLKHHWWWVVVLPKLGKQQYFNCWNYSVEPILGQCQQTNNNVLPTTPCLQILR